MQILLECSEDGYVVGNELLFCLVAVSITDAKRQAKSRVCGAKWDGIGWCRRVESRDTGKRDLHPICTILFYCEDPIADFSLSFVSKRTEHM